MGYIIKYDGVFSDATLPKLNGVLLAKSSFDELKASGLQQLTAGTMADATWEYINSAESSWMQENSAAKIVGPTSGIAMAVVDVESQDVEVTASLNAQAVSNGVAARAIDVDNYIAAQISSGNVEVVTKVAGKGTVITSIIGQGGTGTIMLHVRGTSVSVSKDGTEIWSGTGIDLPSGTRAGLLSHGLGFTQSIGWGDLTISSAI